MSTHSHTGNNITTTMYRRKLHSSREMRYLSTEPQYMYYHKITEYEIKCRMHAHHVAPCAPSSRGELYRRKTLFLDDFPIFFYYPNGTWTHPPTSKLFLDFWNFFNFAKPLSKLANLIVSGRRLFRRSSLMTHRCLLNFG